MVFSINRGDQFQLAQALIFLAILIFFNQNDESDGCGRLAKDGGWGEMEEDWTLGGAAHHFASQPIQCKNRELLFSLLIKIVRILNHYFKILHSCFQFILQKFGLEIFYMIN